MKRGAFFYVLMVLALGALAGLTVLLAPGSRPETPPVRLSQPPAAEVTETPAAAEPGSSVIEVNAETVQTVIATLSRADSYSRTLTARSFWNGGSATAEISVWVRGENARMTIRESGLDAVKNVLLRGGEKWIWYSDSAGVYTGPARPGDADAYQTLLTYEDVLKLDKRDILDAGYTVYDGENCVFVRYTGGLLGYENLCYISVASGLLVGTETYDGDLLVYAVSSSQPDISTQDEAIFTPPERSE